ncbi:hypothetical protein [Desulfotomaculum sp. 1211_IL3151]|uniref:hypothetical protein n=1 Tax=Desulfotomaculum sp. 1211_IL3151 TaxID=3084055 RepID=UPI002FD8AE71
MDEKMRLINRIAQNFADYKTRMLKPDSQAVFEEAEEISAYTQAYQYMTKNHRSKPGECDRQDSLADYPMVKKHGEPER